MLKQSNLYVELILLAVAFFWGVNPAVMKLGMADIPVLSYNAARLLIAVIGAWIAVGISKTYHPIDREDYKKLLMVSAVGFFLFQYLFSMGVQLTTAGNSSLLLGLLPVSVALINWVLRLEKISLMMSLGIILSLFGVLLIIMGSGKELSLSSEHLTGALYLLGAQAFYGYYTIFSKDLLNKYSSYLISAWIFTITTTLFFIPACYEMIHLNWSHISTTGWLSTIFSGAFPLCIGNFLWIWGTGKIGSTKASLYNNIAPIFAVASGYVLLNETFGLLQFSGAAVIFFGLYLTRIKKAAIFSRS